MRRKFVVGRNIHACFLRKIAAGVMAGRHVRRIAYTARGYCVGGAVRQWCGDGGMSLIMHDEERPIKARVIFIKPTIAVNTR